MIVSRWKQPPIDMQFGLRKVRANICGKLMFICALNISVNVSDWRKIEISIDVQLLAKCETFACRAISHFCCQILASRTGNICGTCSIVAPGVDIYRLHTRLLVHMDV